MRRLGAVLLWSVIAAAFIGPGTVTTAASAGAGHGLALLWALTFSTLACLVLQEAAARLTVVSGLSLAQALRRSHPAGFRGAAVLLLVLGGILLGCAAYEAGNILGGVAGAVLVTGASRHVLTSLFGAVAAALLWFNSPRAVARLLSALVALMGISFLWTAVALRPPAGQLFSGLLLPRMPAGAALLALGLVGTTVVPYNLFLGSGLARGQGLRTVRLGLAVSVVLGGVISMGVLVVGTAVEGTFTFDALGGVLARSLGPRARELVAWGLLAAGLTSAVTAPLAAAVTARGLFARGEGDPRWRRRSWRYRSTWLGVLIVGLGFGLSTVQPVPAIVLAQALNGVLLPLIAVFLLIAVNDRRLLGREINGPLANGVLLVVVLVTFVLGTSAVVRAAGRVLGAGETPVGATAAVAVTLALLLSLPVGRRLGRARRGGGGTFGG